MNFLQKKSKNQLNQHKNSVKLILVLIFLLHSPLVMFLHWCPPRWPLFVNCYLCLVHFSASGSVLKLWQYCQFCSLILFVRWQPFFQNRSGLVISPANDLRVSSFYCFCRYATLIAFASHKCSSNVWIPTLSLRANLTTLNAYCCLLC